MSFVADELGGNLLSLSSFALTYTRDVSKVRGALSTSLAMLLLTDSESAFGGQSGSTRVGEGS